MQTNRGLWLRTGMSAARRAASARGRRRPRRPLAAERLEGRAMLANSAPELDTAQSPVLSAISEDTAVPTSNSTANSTLVSSLVAGISDVDASDLQGIAITAVNAANGSLYYTTNGGTAWTAVGTLSGTSSLLLASNANTRLAFVPTVNFNGTISDVFTFRAWDQTSGNAGTNVDTSTNGTTSAFSTATDTVAITVNAVNDAPVATGSASLVAVNEDTAAPAGDTATNLFNANFSDSTDAVTGGSIANTLLGVVVSANAATAAQGTWQWNNGGTWTNIATSLSDASGLYLTSGTGVRFLPAGNFNGAAGSLTVRLVDSSASGLTNGGTVNVSTNGGSTAYSSGTVALSTSITPVNDAPVASGSATLAPQDEDTAAPPGETVTNLFTGNFSDSADAVPNGSTANTLSGVVVTKNEATSAQGKWQWLDITTAKWTDIAMSVAENPGLYLAAATKVRFLPAANWNGSPGSLTIRLVDSSGIPPPANGSTLNVSTGQNGGTTPYSTSTVSLSTFITDVAEPPSTPDLDTTTDKGSSDSDNLTNNASPTFSGTADSNAYVEIYDVSTLLGSTLLGSTRADSSGAWKFVMATAGSTLSGQGDHFIKARASFDNVAWSGYSSALKVTLDTVPPTAPQTPVLDPLSDTGSKGDNKTTVLTPNLTVIAQDVSAQVIDRVTIVLTQGATVISLTATRVSGTDTWQATPSSDMAVGDWTVTAKATDVAGNESSSSPPLALTILTPPVAPQMVDLAAADDSGVSNIDDVTNVTTPTFKVSAPVGATKVELFRGNTSIGLATPAPDGVTWSLTLTEPLADGVYQITAQVTDAGGETSPKSAPLTLTIDTVAPTLQSLASVAPSPRSTPVDLIDSTFSERVFRVAPTAFQLRYNPGTNERSLVLGTATTTPVSPVTPTGATAPGASTWTLGNLQSLTGASGTYTLRLDQTGSPVVVDQAGNRLAYSATPSRQWTTDVTAPTVASIALSPSAQQLRNTAVTSATITFSESVTGVDKNDLELVLNGNPVAFTNAVQLSESGSTYTLSGIGGLTTTSGTYTLRVKAAGSGIQDTLGNNFALDGSVSWQMDAQAPTGSFDTVSSPLGTALQSIGLTFSEAVTGVEKSDLTLTRNGNTVSLANATLTPATGASATYVLTGLGGLTGTDGAYVLTLSRTAGSPIKDAAGNAMAADISRSWTLDTRVPTATIALSPSAGANRNSAVTSATVTLSLAVTGVTSGDFQLTRNGSVIPLPNTVTVTSSDGDTTWTLGNLGTLTAADGDYRLTLVAAGSGIVRAAAPANALAADATTQWTMDAKRPEVSLAVVGRTVSTGSTKFTVQALFDEGVTGFAPGDIAVTTGGVASAPTPVGTDGRLYQFDVTVTPAPQNPVTVSVSDNVVLDAAGNGNNKSTDLKLVTDFTGPTVTLTGPAATTASPFTVQASFSEAVTGFAANDLVVTNGTATVNAISTSLYDISITPSADGPVTIGIRSGAAADASGNVNGPSNTLSVVVDRIRPSVALQSLSGTLSRESLLRFGATFSEPVFGVTAADLTVTNGTVTEVQGSGRSYVFVVQPNADGDVTARLAADIATDAAGNKNTAAPSSATIRSDRTAPTVTVTVTRPTATTVSLVFSEPILGFGKADLRLTRNGAVLALPNAPTNQSSDRKTWAVDLGTATAAEGRYLLELLAGGDGITDDAGNALQANAPQVSWVVDTTSPVAAIGGISAISRAAIDGGTITFSEPVTGVGVSDFELRRDGVVVPLPTGQSGVTVTPAAGPAAAYRISGLSQVTAADGTYSLRLRALGSGIADASGNSLLNDAVANWVVDRTPPTVALGPVTPVIRTTAVTTLPVSFGEAVTGLDAGDFTLRRDGVVVRLAGATVTKTGTSGRDYVLSGLATLTAPAGNYELELRAVNTGIADLAGNALPSAAFAAWANGTPTSPAAVSAAFVPVSPTPRTTPVASATISFSSPVTGVDKGDFTLTRTVNGAPTGLTGFFITGSGSQRTIGGLEALTAVPGDYELRLRANGSGIATAGGTPLRADAVVRWTILPNTAVPPVATITADPPPSTGTAIDAATLQFTAPVSGLTLASLRLTRNGVPVSLADTVLSGSGTTYRLRGLAPISASTANYALTFVAAGSGVTDGSGSAPTADATASWTVTTPTVRAAFLAVGDQRTSPVAGIALRFSTRVKGVDLNDFELLFNGQAVRLRGVTVTGSGASWAIGNLSALQTQRGTYTLRLKRANGDIMDGNGRGLAADAVVSWTIV